MRSTVRVLALCAAALLPACGGGGGGSSAPTLQPDFSLQDVNPNSASTGTNVSPRAYLGLVPGFYFGHATWGFCQSQFGFLNQMQGELIAENAATKIRLLGVNAAGFESGNGTITTSRTLPWLQDTAGAAVWASWAAINRDVIILDTFNIKRDVFNLTLNDLSNATNYAALKARLKLVAGEP